MIEIAVKWLFRDHSCLVVSVCAQGSDLMFRMALVIVVVLASLERELSLAELTVIETWCKIDAASRHQYGEILVVEVVDR